MEKEKKGKKKIGAIVLMVILIIILLLCLVQCQSCSGDADPTGNTTTPTGEPTTEGTGNSEPGTEATTPDEDVTEPSSEATEPSTTPSKPSTEITEPSTDAIEPSGHTHTYTETKTAPGCETEGYTTYTCACGDTFTRSKVAATGHQWGEWVAVQEPTESATGTAERVCPNCAKVETRTLDKVVPQHTHKYTGKVTKAATCSKEGVKTYTCSCGSTYTEAIAKTAHSYKSTVTAPTCTAKGYTTYKCSSCGDTYKADYKDAKGHSYTSKVTKAATCTAEGTKTFTCSCGSSYTEKIAKAAHKYVDTVTKPTCTKEGYTSHTCSACGNSYTDAKKAATGHSYTSKVTTEATCEKDGVKTYTCSKCGDKYTEAIEGSHSWKHVHTDEVGHVEVWLVCRCGWTCTPEDAEEAGYTAENCGSVADAIIEYWRVCHKNSFPLADRRNHTYDTPSEWVVDTPATDKWVCTECGKETTTNP